MHLVNTAMLSIMLIMVADVSLRYFANEPLAWAYDLIAQYLMVAVFFFSLSTTQREGENIRVDVLVRVMPTRLHHALCCIGFIASTIMLLIIAYEGGHKTLVAWRAGEVLAGVVAWPTWVANIMVPIGAGMLAVRLSISTVAYAIHALKPGIAGSTFDGIEKDGHEVPL